MISFANLHVIRHPLVQQKLTYLRDKNTSHREFRKLLSEITAFMIFEITQDLKTKDIQVETPLETTTAQVLADHVVLVPVLRAGLGMLDGALDLIPNAKVGHIGLYRNEQTLEPVEYYAKFPPTLPEATAIMLDPMLATGGSSSAAVALLKRKKARHIKCLSLVAAPEGVERMLKDHPDVMIYTAGLDRQLNEHGYIVPGLGDAGDRLYGTK
ncbi:MAG TPA: uracil phosphoribosyltransferase [bacterium]|nr:uracil phosphoribosyltransferase [bacterium]HNC50206.1 uracil phosphoribosyltransferase [bacterium]HND76475.1 uracil phosphoribosyltransferase [bacterium]HNH28201.1 uracil phosphoribosyltransferase [bacterium]HNM15854.1 uracil phosphoribosyltransferase [bacterium]